MARPPILFGCIFRADDNLIISGNTGNRDLNVQVPGVEENKWFKMTIS